MNIQLLGKSVLIKRDVLDKQTGSGIFLGDNLETLDTGVITHIGVELLMQEWDNEIKLAESGICKDTSLIGSRVKFKEAFGETIKVDGEDLLFFRELEPSIYFFILDENKE